MTMLSRYRQSRTTTALHAAGLAAVVAVFALASTGTAAAATVRVTIDKLAFSPVNVEVHVGDTVEWVNHDFVAHTATAKARGWDVMIPPGKSAQLVVKKAGTVDYFCRFHPNMKGKVVIAP
jgi:plastocyanin